MPKETQYVIVKLFDHEMADDIAKEIVHNLEEVDEAVPAYNDGFGHLVQIKERAVKHDS